LFAIFTLPSMWLSIRPEWEVPRARIDAALRMRNGVIISEWLAEKNGWKIGDTFTLKNGQPKKDGGTHWAVEVAGIMHDDEAQGDIRFFLANHTYLDETRAYGQGTVNRYLMRVVDASRATQIARQIDTMLATPVATRTQTEQDQAQSALARIGDF